MSVPREEKTHANYGSLSLKNMIMQHRSVWLIIFVQQNEITGNSPILYSMTYLTMIPFFSAGSCHSSFKWNEPRSVADNDITGPGSDMNPALLYVTKQRRQWKLGATRG